MKKTAIIFPGQGSQYIEMGKGFLEVDSDARTLMAMGSEKSGFDLQTLCLEGPASDLTRVLHLQPALTIINLMCWQQLKKSLPDFKPSFLAGHSLGEYSALHAAGVLSAEDTMLLVTERGRLMEREGNANPGGMQAVLGMTIEKVDEVLASYSGPGQVVVANHNSEQQVVISGDKEGLKGAGALFKEQGGKVIPLKVSVANHSPLVAGAIEDFSIFMNGVTFETPSVPVLFNISSEQEGDPARIRSLMAKQIGSRVRWFDSMQKMIDNGVELFIELGPKNVLKGLMKKILPRDTNIICLQADTPETIEEAARHIAG